MPNIRSAIKHMRSDAKKFETNRMVLSNLHTRYKKLQVLVKEDKAKAAEYARELVSKLDKAVTRGIIKHKRADNKKARIGRLFHKSK